MSQVEPLWVSFVAINTLRPWYFKVFIQPIHTSIVSVETSFHEYGTRGHKMRMDFNKQLQWVIVVRTINL